MTKIILDTSIVIELLKNNADIIAQLVPYDQLIFTTIGLGELYHGAYNSKQLQKHLQECVSVRADFDILLVTDVTSEHYGRIKTDLRKLGKMIPENDLWIAAIALENGIGVVTSDKHFMRIASLEVILLSL